jgi:glutathione synthase/RimK-type ligase-like ATP-grasp enzyme
MILIVTNKQDVTADFVVRELQRRCLGFFRLNTDEFPINATASFQVESGYQPKAVLRLLDRERILNWGDVRAIWYRRPVPPVISPDITDSGVRKFATDEAYDFLRGLWYSTECFWMSEPNAIRRAEHKIVQLREAHAIGLTIPRTLVTNSADELRAFFKECPSGLVAKPLYLGYIEEQNQGKFIYTTRLCEGDLADKRAIQFTPSIYQELIPKIADIRVTVVGHSELFATKITAENLVSNIPDWRSAELSDLRHAQYALPDDEREKCFQLVKRLGLEFGAIDYVLDQSGRHVFLEINPNGQWAWIESATGVNISAAIVDTLTSHQ